MCVDCCKHKFKLCEVTRSSSLLRAFRCYTVVVAFCVPTALHRTAAAQLAPRSAYTNHLVANIRVRENGRFKKWNVRLASERAGASKPKRTHVATRASLPRRHGSPHRRIIDALSGPLHATRCGVRGSGAEKPYHGQSGGHGCVSQAQPHACRRRCCPGPLHRGCVRARHVLGGWGMLCPPVAPLCPLWGHRPAHTQRKHTRLAPLTAAPPPPTPALQPTFASSS